jgi:apolipoprotein N-acyltransferase
VTFALPTRLSWRAALAFFAGALAMPAFAPFQLWPLVILSLALLFALWQSATSKRQAALLGFCWGLGIFLSGVSWLFVSLNTYGGMPAPLAALAVLLFSSFISLLPAFGGVLAHALRRNASPAFTLLITLPACFVVGEYLRMSLLTGFPWLIAGYSQTPGSLLGAPLAGYAPVIGVFGISWLLALTAGALVMLMKATRQMRIAVSVALAAVWIGGPMLKRVTWTEPSGAPFTVALLQGNIDQDLKFRDDQLVATLKNYYDLANESKAKLIVLPETAVPRFADDLPAEYLGALNAIALRNGGDMLLGIPTYIGPKPGETTISYFNSAISLGGSPSQTYSKTHLVAFGEFIPPMFSWVYQWLSIPMSGFTRGAEDQAPMRLLGHRVAVNICYEDTFGHEIARPLPDAELLINLSNMAWYGRSLAADQHAQFSQMRAMETGRWMLRSTNTGLTAAINERGEIVKALPQFVRGALEVEAQPRRGATPYVRWKDSPVLLLLFLAMGVALLGIKQGKKKR